MGVQNVVQIIIDGLVQFAADLLMPFMVIMFILGIIMRGLIHLSLSRESWFSKEFSKRVDKFIEESDLKGEVSFYVVSKRILEKTFYELFEVRAIMMRRKPDYVTSLADRMFLIHHGCARLVKDSLKQIRFLKHDNERPDFKEIFKHVCEKNPAFNKVFGIIPSSLFNDILSILPGLFIVGGIFGTFLGIMKALPELGGMDLNDIEGSKAVMDEFLLKVSFSMSTSIIGILLSICMQVFNTIFSPDKLFVGIVDRYKNSFALLWNLSTNNKLPEDIPDFDEHKDPIEALAEQAVDKQFNKTKKRKEEKQAS